MNTRLNKALLLIAIVVLYAVFVVAQTPPGAYNSPSLGGGSGSLPSGLTFTLPTLTVSGAGSGNGCVALSGNTSGTATLCAPAVAGTRANGLVSSNAINLPGALGAPAIGFSDNATTGIFDSNNIIVVQADQLNVTQNAGVNRWIFQNSSTFNFTPAGNNVEGIGDSTHVLTNLFTNLISLGANCSSSAAPAVCGAAASGSVVVAAAATTVTVNTTAVTANSQILLTRDDSLGTKLSVTCNTATVMGEMKVSARTGGTSFQITVQTAPATNPGCISYTIVN